MSISSVGLCSGSVSTSEFLVLLELLLLDEELLPKILFSEMESPLMSRLLSSPEELEVNCTERSGSSKVVPDII